MHCGVPRESPVCGEIHCPHPPRAELALDAVPIREHGGQSISETLAHRSVRRSTGERDEEALGQMRGLIGHGVVPAHTPMPSFLAATAKAGSVLS